MAHDSIPPRKRKAKTKTPIDPDVVNHRRRMPTSLKGPKLQQKLAANQEKRRQALILRRSGCTYMQIAAEMKLSGAMVAWRYVAKAIALIPREEAIEVKGLALVKLDAQEFRLNSILRRKGDKIGVNELCKIELALVRIAERRARLEGHDAPTKTEVTGKDGAPIAMSWAQIQGMSDADLERAVANAGRGRGPQGAGAGTAQTAPGETRKPH